MFLHVCHCQHKQEAVVVVQKDGQGLCCLAREVPFQVESARDVSRPQTQPSIRGRGLAACLIQQWNCMMGWLCTDGVGHIGRIVRCSEWPWPWRACDKRHLELKRSGSGAKDTQKRLQDGVQGDSRTPDEIGNVEAQQAKASLALRRQISLITGRASRRS